ncbi:hypothetical protein FG475_22870 [Vibrio navarrensis]|nr:hypothetical protein [Vibrio navarrensis]
MESQNQNKTSLYRQLILLYFLPKPLLREGLSFFSCSHNALLSSEACTTKASASLSNHSNQRKPEMPRMPNLLEQFVSPIL